MNCIRSITMASLALTYSGMQTRPIKALSDQQMADLKAGRGMSLALAVELNGYPGRSHLLELADKVGLSDAQQSTVRSLFEAMKAETVPIGERKIEQEAALDRLFAGRTATRGSAEAAVASISETQGKLRAAHLKYRVSAVAMLQPDQITRYGQLRGYGHDTPMQHRHQ
jgi:hypothetical protein